MCTHYIIPNVLKCGNIVAHNIYHKVRRPLFNVFFKYTPNLERFVVKCKSKCKHWEKTRVLKELDNMLKN